MVVRRGEWHDDFCAAAHMVEVWWRAFIHDGSAGVLVYSTTGVANRTGSIDDWEVFFLPGVLAGCILGATTWQCLGTVRSLYPRASSYRTMFSFLQSWYGHEGLYHGFAGYSQNGYTEDNQYHAVDWYWQAPGELTSSRYNWYILTDVKEPDRWIEATKKVFRGRY